jgi:hypothetical protein
MQSPLEHGPTSHHSRALAMGLGSTLKLALMLLRRGGRGGGGGAEEDDVWRELGSLRRRVSEQEEQIDRQVCLPVWMPWIWDLWVCMCARGMCWQHPGCVALL